MSKLIDFNKKKEFPFLEDLEHVLKPDLQELARKFSSIDPSQEMVQNQRKEVLRLRLISKLHQELTEEEMDAAAGGLTLPEERMKPKPEPTI